MRLLCVLLACLVLIPYPSAAQSTTTDPARLAPALRSRDVSILEHRRLDMFNPLGDPNAIEPTITITPVGQLGYDATFDFTNTTNTPKPLGRLCIGVFTLGQNITYTKPSRGCTLVDTTWNRYIGQAWPYPGSAYSPMISLMNDDFAVGVSLIYPVLEYKHDVLVRLVKGGGVFKGPKATRGWIVYFDLNNGPHANRFTTLAHPAMLEPGRHRRYTVAVRAIKRNPARPRSITGEQDWLETLLPYRDYFQSKYGPVQYQRNPRPVLARELSNASAQSSRNPRGLLGGKSKRPDLVGFTPIAQELARPTGYPRLMLWAPSGLFDKGSKFNYPSRFTLGWNDLPRLRTAVSSRGLPLIPRSGTQLGLWWGRSSEYASKWNDTHVVPLDITNAEHMQSVVEQLTLASKAGATMIGLDNFVHHLLPVWDQVAYLRALHILYPSLTFITEPISCDVVHVVAPTFVRDFRAPKDGTRESDFHQLRGPHYFADFLLPGHEIWGYFRYPEIKRVRPTRITPARVQRDADRIASFGFVPVMATRFPLGDPASATAAETWRTTVPASLRPADP
ncbi:MAG TPA: hypothetical protein ENJ00_04745 [Phycisphaerales bacterium]|nr:hypothetical protein [Phycisphaerales bacterium]